MIRSVWRALAASAAVALAAAGIAGQALAQTYPERPMRLVVGFPPGGPTDIMGRMFAAQVSEFFRTQQMIVDNRPGAGGNIAADHVAKSAPDGYTMLLTHLATHGISPTLYAKLPYDPIKDFTPVTQLVAVPNLLVVHPSVPAKSVKELIGLARQQPGKLNFASGGNGTSGHLSGVLLRSLAEIDIVHVPYKGGAPAMTDLTAGVVQIMVDNMQALLPHVRAGRLRALGVTTASRIPAVPELPTIAEAGVPGYEVATWFGIVLPAGVPQPVVAKLNEAFLAALKSPEIQKRLPEMGASPVGSSPEQFGRHIRAEIAKWAPIVKASGARID